MAGFVDEGAGVSQEARGVPFCSSGASASSSGGGGGWTRGMRGTVGPIMGGKTDESSDISTGSSLVDTTFCLVFVSLRRLSKRFSSSVIFEVTDGLKTLAVVEVPFFTNAEYPAFIAAILDVMLAGFGFSSEIMNYG